MPIPEQDILQQGDILEGQRNPGFETENLPSPNGSQAPQVAPIAIPGTGETATGGTAGYMNAFKASVLGVQDKITPGKLPQFSVEDIYNPRYKSILPGEDSEEVFALEQPWYKKWGNAFTKMAATAVGTFWNGITTIPDTISALANGGPIYDSQSANDIDVWLKNLENEFPNYYTKWQQEHPFMSAIPFSGGFANFWGDKVIKNLGFTVGAIGAAVVTDAAAGAVTGGIGEIPLIGQQVGKAALWLNKIFTGEDKVKELVTLGRAAGRQGEQLLQLKGLAQAAAATRVTNGTRYALSLYGSAAVEAGFEARDGYNTVRQDLLEAYQRENGYSATGDDLKQIDDYARAAANVRFGINLALLSVSNAVQFDAFLKPFSAARNGYRSAVQRELAESSKIGLAEGSIDTFTQAGTKSLRGKWWGKVRPLAPAVLTEGVFEEGGQYAAQIGTENYYERKYLFDKGLSSKQYSKDETPWNAKDQMDNIIHSTVAGMAAQFGTDEGLENILIGGITGALFGGITRYASRAQDARTRQTVLNTLNSKGVTDILRNTYDSAVKSHRIAEDMKQAAASNDVFKYKNFQHEAFVEFVTSGLKAGKFDVRMDQLDMLTGMDNDQFKQAFGIEKTPENVRTVGEYVHTLKNKASSIKRSYDLINETFINPFVFRPKATTEEHLEENRKYTVFEDWKADLTYLSSIAPDVQQRLSEIDQLVKSIHPSISIDIISNLADRKYLRDLSDRMKKEASDLQKSVDTKASADIAADRARIRNLTGRAQTVDAVLSDPAMPLKKFESIFSNLLNYQLNGESDAENIIIPQEAVPQLIKYGEDVKRLRIFQDKAYEAFDKLSTEEGFNKYYNDVVRGEEKQPEFDPISGSTPTPPAEPPVLPEQVTIKEGDNNKSFDKDKEYLVNVEGKDTSNPELVKVVGQTEDGVTVEKKDGSFEVVPAENFFKEDKLASTINEASNQETSTTDVPPVTPKEAETKRSESKKDLSFGLYSTTDPPYDLKTTPDDNYQRRHQNFLFNLGSTDWVKFTPENKPKIRIIPVNGKNYREFGFPEGWIPEGLATDDADNGAIRAVYVIDNRFNLQEQREFRRKIQRALTSRKETPDWIQNAAKNDLDGTVQMLYEQHVSTIEGNEDQLFQAIGEEALDLIIDYKEGGIFFVDDEGDELARLGEPVDPSKVIYTTFATTDLQFGENREERYTNKSNLDPVKMQDWWRDKRKELLDISTMEDAISYISTFSVSRGIPNVINNNSKNGVVEVGLIRQQDLDKPIITIPTAGNVAVVGAFNDAGEGVPAAKEGVNMPLGQPVLNYGGNLIFLNNRNLTGEEAENIFQLLRIVSDRSSTENKAAIFKYLHKVVYLFNAERAKTAAPPSSITIVGASLQLGNTKLIDLTPESMDANKEDIITFLTSPTFFHAVKNSELLKIAENPNSPELQFVELGVEEGKIVQKNVWKNYNYYLLSTKTPDGKNRGIPPLTTNIIVPVEGEVPIIQKYSVVDLADFEISGMKAPQKTVAPAPTPGAQKKADIQQGIEEAGPDIKWVEIKLPTGPTKFGFMITETDSQGNIVDIEPMGTLQPDGSIKPFTSPQGVKSILLNALKQNQPTKDETNTPSDDDEGLGNPNLRKGKDTQYRLFTLGNSNYKRGNLDEEFKEFARIIPDPFIIRTVDHLLRTTSGGLAWGAVQDAMVYVYKNAEVGTTYHEAFEVIWNHFLTGKEQQDLYDEFVSREGSFKTYTGSQERFSDATMKEAKEQLAEEFRDYKLSGKLPDTPKKRSFFQRLLDFIKRIIFGDSSDINLLFKRINKGYYRNFASVPKNPVKGNFYREIGVDNFSETTIQDMLQGMTAELFSEIFKDNANIITQLEENPELSARSIYDRLKERFTFYFEDRAAPEGTLTAELGVKYQQLQSDDDKKALVQQVRDIRAQWAKIKDNWGAFVKEHERYLRVFNVEFIVDDEGNISFDEDVVDVDENEQKNMVEYGRDIFRIDAKNNASSKVKLLMATISDSAWRSATKSAVEAATNTETIIKREASTLTLPKLAPYAKLFNYLLHNSANINGIYQIWEHLRDMVSEPSTRKNIDANVQRLLNRIDFDNGFENKNVAQVKIILALENALSKQKPAFFRQFTDYQRNTYFKTSVTNSKIDQLKASWIAGIKGSDAIKEGNERTFVFSTSVIGIQDNIEFLNKIGIDIRRDDYRRLKGAAITRFNKAVNTVKSIVERAARDKTAIPIISSKQLDFDSRLNELAEVYVTYIVGDDTQSQHPNLDNEPTSNFVLNNFVSTILSDANNSSSKEAFVEKIDNQYFNDIFHQDSLLLNKVIFNADGSFNKPVEIGVVEGRETWDQDNRATSNLTEAERQLYEINNNLNGVFYTLLPADAKTEWAINAGTYYSVNNFFGDDTSRGNELASFVRQMYNWLQTEVSLARDYNRRSYIDALRRKVNGREVGKSLRFFRDILPSDIVEVIHREAIDGGKGLSEVIGETQFAGVMRDFVRQKADRTLENLIDWRVIDETSGEYRLHGFDRAFLDTHFGKKNTYTADEVKRLLTFREMNYVVNNIEMHKFFFGDPAQYKDELKRVKSFLSGREITHVDTLQNYEGFNQWANSNLNRVGNVELSPSDPGYHTFKNHANTLTVYDVTFESASLKEIQEAIGEKAAKPYTEGNEADAQAWITPTSYREIVWKSGGSFTAAQEEQFQWEMAWERRDKAKEGLYTYSSEQLKEADNEKLKKNPDPRVSFPILKLVHSGIQSKENIAIVSLDKASWAPIFYRWVKGSALAEVYNQMQKFGVDYIRMESAHKVGIQKPSSLSLYTSEGDVNKEGFSSAVTEPIPFKQLGIQVRQSKKDKGVTEGSQLRKIAIGDLRSNGVPVDFMKDFRSEDSAFQVWNNLSEEERLAKSPIYSKIKKHDNALINLVAHRTIATMRKLGMVNTEEGPIIPDKKQISDFILSELERRELPRNIAAGIQVLPDGTDFTQPLEANPQYTKIRSIIYSVLDKTISRPKVNGGQKTMLSVTGFERGARIVKGEVNGKPVYISNDLSFYKRGQGSTEACEVYLPYWFGKKLSDARSRKSQEEILDYLNNTEDGKKLLSGIGFRIPTQGLNSVDFFTVKGFLPEQMGDVIVLPSEITVKAGSDFDIDKLNVYLRNFYIDPKTGYPKLFLNKGSEQETKDYLDQLITEKSIIPSELREGLEEYIAQETEGYDPDDLMIKLAGAEGLFSEERIITDYLEQKGLTRDVLLDIFYLKSLENEYFDSIQELASLPENYGRLVTPNDASELKSYRDKILSLKEQKRVSLGDYGKLLDSRFMMQERQAYMASKQVVGVSATSQTAHAVGQNLDGGLIIRDPAIIARFPHNTIDGQLTLGSLYTAGKRSLISNINSQTTDGGVDVAKDKFLAEMGINRDTLSTFLTLVRMGADPWWAVLYLNQPGIQWFLKTKAIHSSVSQINPSVKNDPDFQLLEEVYAKLGGIGKNKSRVANKPNVYTIRDMEDAISTYSQGRDLSQTQQTLQLMMLDDYIRWDNRARKYQGYNSLAWDLFHYYQGYNWDTVRVTDPNTIRLKNLKFERAKQLAITPVTKVMQDTFIGAMKENTELLNSGLTSIINVQKGIAAGILDRIAEDIFRQPFLNEYLRTRILLTAELSMLDFAVQTNSSIAGKSLNSFIFPLLLGEKSVARYVKAIQNSFDKRLRNNPFINNLLANIDNRQSYPSIVQMIEKDYDTYTSNIWTDAFRELRDDATIVSVNDNPADDKTISQIYNNLVLLAIIQSGSKRTSSSMSHLIPAETYGEFTRDALRNMNLQSFYDNMVLYRTNWNFPGLVPNAEVEFDPMLEIYMPELPGEYPFLTGETIKILQNVMNRTKTPGILNVMAWKYRKFKAIKIIDFRRDEKGQIIGQTARLFARIDVQTPEGVAPLSIMKGRILFKEINVWGDGANIQEYYDSNNQSVLLTNSKVNEATDEDIIYSLHRAGAQSNVDPTVMTTIIDKYEGGNSTPEQQGDDNPTPFLQIDDFEAFKNSLRRKDC